MTTPTDTYDNPLIGRYASREMSERWGPLRKFRTWRKLWLALAEAQHDLRMPAADGVTPRITLEHLTELRAHLDDIDLKRAAEHEKRLRHDVMAQIHALKDVAPGCGDILHLGATSCYVTDNADLILMRESLNQVCTTLAAAIDALGRFAEQWKDEPTLGFTHFQPAQLTTVGKRAVLWLYDLTLDLQDTGSDDGTFSNRCEKCLGLLRAEVDYTSIADVIDRGMHEFIDHVQSRLNELGHAIYEDFFAVQKPAARTAAAGLASPPAQSQTQSQSSGQTQIQSS